MANDINADVKPNNEKGQQRNIDWNRIVVNGFPTENMERQFKNIDKKKEPRMSADKIVFR